MCDRPATSKQHVPPRCFFPDQKDFPGVDYRKNLITVPSCNLHNLSISDDDFYILFIISSHIKNTDIAKRHFSTKIIRALGYRPEMKSFISKYLPVTVKGEDTIAYTINRKRFDNSFCLMARALYFHHFNEKWHQDIIVHTASLVNIGAPNLMEFHDQMIEMEDLAAQALHDCELLGENSDIFTYKKKGLTTPLVL